MSTSISAKQRPPSPHGRIGAPAARVGFAGAVPIDRISPILVRRPADVALDSESRRSKIWELAPTLHCSIIGTCLTTAELRFLIKKFAATRDETPSDHDLHAIAVTAAGKHDLLAKQLNKALDRRHRSAVSDFGRARSTESLRTLWDEAVQRGDIPGAYWALLTHPSASDSLVKHVFGDVHMLSHLVGAANRADIRRLRQLEDEKAALEDKIARQQQHLHGAIASREEKIRDLNAALAARIEAENAAAPPAADRSSEVDTLGRLVADLRRQLGAETARRARAEQRLDDALAARVREDQARLHAEHELSVVRAELEIVEARLATWLDGDKDGDELDLAGTTILYVGGRPHQVARLRALVERSAGRFLHHDGGVEEKTDLLPGLASRADSVFFPVDCISHEAVQSLKRACRQANKPFVPLRSSGLTSLLRALASPDVKRLRT